MCTHTEITYIATTRLAEIADYFHFIMQELVEEEKNMLEGEGGLVFQLLVRRRTNLQI